MKKIISIIKKVTISLCLLYTFNLIISPTGFLIPLNTTSIILTSLLGMPFVLGLFILTIII